MFITKAVFRRRPVPCQPSIYPYLITVHPAPHVVYIFPYSKTATSRNQPTVVLARRPATELRKRLATTQTSRAKDSITYSVPFSAALRLAISRFSLAFSFFTRAVSSPCSLNFSISSSFSSLPLLFRALTILPNSPLNFS